MLDGGPYFRTSHGSVRDGLALAGSLRIQKRNPIEESWRHLQDAPRNQFFVSPDTADCNILNEFGTQGWRISLGTYSRQYDKLVTAVGTALPTVSTSNHF
jgi:hypothetical protein